MNLLAFNLKSKSFGIITRDAFGRTNMTKPEKLESRPVMVPECFSGERSYEDWINQFESMAEINHWNDEQKLMWLKVYLTGRALMVLKKFPVTVRNSYKNNSIV